MADVNYRWEGVAQQPAVQTMAQQPAVQTMASVAEAGKQARIAALESELAQVNAEIARLEAQGHGNGELSEIAAKRAEAGDMGVYNQLLSTAQSRTAGAQGIRQGAEEAVWNGIYNAQNLSYDLDKDDETVRARKLAMRSELEKAERTAQNAGVELPKKWHDLWSMVENVSAQPADDSMNVGEWANTFYTKSRNGTLTNKDVKEVEDYIADNPNSTKSTELKQLVAQYKGKTREARKARAVENSKWDAWYNKYANDPNVATLINRMSPKERKAFDARFTFDEKTGIVRRK